MKRSLILAGCSSLLALAVFAEVTSVNRVGYNKMTIEKGKLYLIATAFENIDGQPLTAQDVIGDQLPPASKCWFYDGSPYKVDSRSGIGSQQWSSNIDFHGFMGFWVKVPASAAEASYELVLKGQVPDASSTSNMLWNGLNMLGFPYTADVAFTNTQLYAQSVPGDKMYVYDPSINNYLPAMSKSGIGSQQWSAAAKALVLKEGMGFWYISNRGDDVLQENRPYPTN